MKNFNKISGIIAGVAVSALALTGCGSADQGASGSKSEGASGSAAASADSWEAPEGLKGEISYYSANPQGLTDDLVAAFEDKTEVKVNVFAGSTGEVTAKLKAEEGNPQADVVYLASWTAATKQDKAGVLEEFKPEGVDAIHSNWVSETGTFNGRDGSALALVTNTDVVDEVPEDWEDLTDEKYKDKVIMPDPRESGTAGDLVAGMVANFGKDKTWELFDKLFDNGMTVQGANGPALDAVTSGSKGVVFGGVDYSAYKAQSKGEPLEVKIAKSGTTVSPRPVMVLKDSDNKEAAEAFVNFMFSDEAQAISADNNMIPANAEVSPANGPELKDIKQLSEDWDEIVANSKDVKEEFVKRYLK
ncbi:ABC transporter substrate-binding protein [Corynebacterium incognita]|uniref:ABC transporter substrate-binding protein n=1 Tax=Corynebacterium incognita TaxID=2754725 RepID=A0A7G7CQH8_9CORY|nr:ABC transporter substrate-binding protein [Corynebacterium incognita]QNE89844.1 ABC transporter substrate-binding protein [Corynebacterium incognita]